MTPVEYHLKLAIYHWCGATADQYVPDSKLGDIWQGRQPAIAYAPEGVRRLYLALLEDPGFKLCDAVHHMIPGEFYPGGDLQTVKQLYIRLLACAVTPVDPNGVSTFS
jgi:hypothetical protein